MPVGSPDIFLDFKGEIKGESKDNKHKDQIDVESWSWGATQLGTAASGGGAGASKVSFQDLSIVKRVDKASPLLLKACATGQHIKEAILTQRKAGGESLEFIIVKLEDIIISSYGPSAHNGGDLPMEQLSLNYSKVEYKYQEQDEKGKAKGGPVIFKFDLKANKPG